jgi:hypothetical protein
MSASLEMVIGLIEVRGQIQFFLLGELLADRTGALFHAIDESVGAFHDAIGTGENGTAIAAHLAFVASAAFILSEQFLSNVRVAFGEKFSLRAAGD